MNLQSVICKVISSTKATIKEKDISISNKVDSAIPVAIIGKQLLLTHILHGLINDAVNSIIKGRITIKAKLFHAEEQNVVVQFMVAFSSSALTTLDSAIKDNTASHSIRSLKKLIEKQGGSFEEATAPGLGKQYRFSLKFQYGEVATPISKSRKHSFAHAWWSLGKMFAHPSMRQAIN